VEDRDRPEGAESCMADKYDIVSIGHITRDTLDDRGKVSHFTGGGAYFSAFAARRSGARVLVVTRLAKEDLGLLQELRGEGIEVVVRPGPRTTSIENIFETADRDSRRVRLLCQAEPFRLEDVPEVETGIYNLSGLFRGEIPPDMIEPLAARAKVGLDLQGMLRTSEGGVFSWQDWPEKKRYLPFLAFLKADSLESEVITGTGNRREAAELLHDWGAGEVMITHSSEVIVFDGKKLCSAPFKAANLSGRTGRGDTCFTAYLVRRLDHDLEESLRYAAALTAMKMERPGPFKGTQEQVLERMKGL
jgi:sugar/nucleoside kinase (ribokinase family)